MAAVPAIKEKADEYKKWRRHLHQYPETSFEEVKTADYIAGLLESWGIAVHRGLAKTGVVGVIKGKKGSSSRAIGLRADIDALNIFEETNAAHASKIPGKMHACGHDGHTTMLLAAAKYLAETRNFDGTVNLIFQPAEEGGGGGNVMVQEGFFKKFPCDAVFGMHNWPWLATGKMAVSPGAVSASTDSFEVKIIGKGGHAAFPHKTIDVIVCASQIVTTLQTLVSRTVDPLDSVVVSVCKFHAGAGALNVLPESVEIGGTIRTLKPAIREAMEKKFRHVVKSVAETFGATVDITWHDGYPSVVNTVPETDFCRTVAEELVGADNVLPFTPMMGGEDFSYFLRESKGTYIILGQGRTDNDPGLHSPHYDFNDDATPIGASYWVKLVEKWLK